MMMLRAVILGLFAVSSTLPGAVRRSTTTNEIMATNRLEDELLAVLERDYHKGAAPSHLKTEESLVVMLGMDWSRSEVGEGVDQKFASAAWFFSRCEIGENSPLSSPLVLIRYLDKVISEKQAQAQKNLLPFLELFIEDYSKLDSSRDREEYVRILERVPEGMLAKLDASETWLTILRNRVVVPNASFWKVLDADETLDQEHVTKIAASAADLPDDDCMPPYGNRHHDWESYAVLRKRLLPQPGVVSPSDGLLSDQAGAYLLMWPLLNRLDEASAKNEPARVVINNLNDIQYAHRAQLLKTAAFNKFSMLRILADDPHMYGLLSRWLSEDPGLKTSNSWLGGNPQTFPAADNSSGKWHSDFQRANWIFWGQFLTDHPETRLKGGESDLGGLYGADGSADDLDLNRLMVTAPMQKLFADMSEENFNKGVKQEPNAAEGDARLRRFMAGRLEPAHGIHPWAFLLMGCLTHMDDAVKDWLGMIRDHDATPPRFRKYADWLLENQLDFSFLKKKDRWGRVREDKLLPKGTRRIRIRSAADPSSKASLPSPSAPLPSPSAPLPSPSAPPLYPGPPAACENYPEPTSSSDPRGPAPAYPQGPSPY